MASVNMDLEATDGSCDEIENPLGDPVAGKNIDEFLRNIWTAEESQAMADALNPLDGSDGCLSLQKQKSLCLRSMRMEEAERSWGAAGGQQKALWSAGATEGQQQCLHDEVTLEDFLVKAGIVRECPSPCFSDGLLSPVHTPVQQGDCRMRNPYNKAFSQSSHSNTPLSPASSSTQFAILGQPGRKSRAEVPLEKVIQRRQRRMIKNRESAARSRARKQAYTMELEEEVLQLKEENMRLLRKQEEASELRQNQERCHIPSWGADRLPKGDTDLERWCPHLPWVCGNSVVAHVEHYMEPVS